MKKILAAAIAAAIVPMAAVADTNNVTVYGKVHMSVDMNDFSFTETLNGAVVDSGSIDDYTVESRSSRLGFKGSEDLGNGLKAIWQYEMTYAGLDGDGQFPVQSGIGSARNSYIGLAGDWGTFLVGRHDTPTKVAYYAAGVEELGDSILDLNSGTGGLFSEFRANNAIAYISPSFSGFTVAGAMVPGESGSPCVSTDCDGIADHYSVAAIYSGNGLKASIGYESKDLSDVASGLGATDFSDETILQIGASYTMNAFKLGAMYQDISDLDSVSGLDYMAWAIVGSFSFGNSKVIAQYGQADVDGVGVDGDGDTYGIGFQHMFSKRTSAYVAYANAEFDESVVDGADTTKFNTEGDQFSVGMIHSF
jgi:predicted porin